MGFQSSGKVSYHTISSIVELEKHSSIPMFERSICYYSKVNGTPDWGKARIGAGVSFSRRHLNASRASDGRSPPPQPDSFARSFVNFPANFAYPGIKALK